MLTIDSTPLASAVRDTAMRRLLPLLLLPFCAAAPAQYTLRLNFVDRSVELCDSTGFAIDYLLITVNVSDCRRDTIFLGDMGG
jgi:hypothetical protein